MWGRIWSGSIEATGLLAAWMMSPEMVPTVGGGGEKDCTCFHQTTFSTRTGTSLESPPREIQFERPCFWAMVFPERVRGCIVVQKFRSGRTVDRSERNDGRAATLGRLRRARFSGSSRQTDKSA